MAIITCDHCGNMRKNLETGTWNCTITEIPSGKCENDTCLLWFCAICGFGAAEKKLLIDGNVHTKVLVSHESCWLGKGE